MTEPTLEDIAETAMCLWEHFLDQEPDNYREYRELFGACDARLRVLSWAVACDAAHNYAFEGKGYDDAFDWHFVPLWCEHCIDDNFELITSNPEEAFVLMFGQSVTEDKSVEELKNEIAELRNLLAQVQRDLEQTQRDFDAYKHRQRIRQRTIEADHENTKNQLSRALSKM